MFFVIYLRYDFFNYVANKVSADKIAIAHTENDNAETVLMNLMRGASLEGLKGIEPIRGKFIRPLIECSRDEIEAYCEENKLDPKFDKTNNDNIYTRNKIRNLLIPYIKKEFNPNIVDSLNRLAVLARQDAKYFSEIVKKDCTKFNCYSIIILLMISDHQAKRERRKENGEKKKIAVCDTFCINDCKCVHCIAFISKCRG